MAVGETAVRVRVIDVRVRALGRILWRPEAGVLGACVAVTALLVALPGPHVAIERPGLQAVIATVAGISAGLVSLLFVGRVHRHRRRSDLLLAAAMLAIATSHLAFSALPHALHEPDELPVHMWATVPVDVLAALGFAGAALARERRIRGGEGRWVMAGLIAVLGGIGAAVLALAGALPAPVVTETTPGGMPDFVGHPVIVGSQLLAAGTFLCAAVLFASRAKRERDVILRWLGVGALLAAFSRLNFAASPSAFTGVVSVGDLLRLLTHAVLLGVCLYEMRRFYRGVATGAVFAERRRIARDLHDGAAQEIAFILRRSQRMAAAGDEAAAVIAASARRALEDSRRAISALSRSPDEPLDQALTAATRSTASRAGVELRLDLEPGLLLPPASCDAVIRIACEAVGNAARHSGASGVRVELREADGVLLRVADDGRGFCPERPPDGFGLRGMRERARSVGGELAIHSAPGRGTEVELRLP